MTMKPFTPPISILVGLGFLYQVDTASGAYVVLNEWGGTRGPLHALALDLCRSAADGKADTEAARIAFENFAQTRGILARDPVMAAANRAAAWLSA